MPLTRRASHIQTLPGRRTITPWPPTPYRMEGERVVRWGSGPLVIWNWFHAFGGSLYSSDLTKALLTSREIEDATLFMTGLHKT